MSIRIYLILILFILICLSETSFSAEPLKCNTLTAGSSLTDSIKLLVKEERNASAIASVNTSTLTAENRITPFLAIDGEFSKQPVAGVDPTALNYYSLFPERFNSSRETDWGFAHFEIYKFWKLASSGEVKEEILHYGKISDGRFYTPYALYSYSDYPGSIIYVMMQNGNYHFFSSNEQININDQTVTLYRGVTNKSEFIKNDFSEFKEKESLALELWHRYQFWLSSESGRAFSVSHMQVARAETDNIKMRDLRTPENPFDIHAFVKELKLSPEEAELLFKIDNKMNYNRHWTSQKTIASEKFGPNYITVETPLSNIRITSHGNNEKEIQIIDPSFIDYIDEHFE